MGGYILQSKQTDLGIPQGRVFSVTLFLLAINGILGEIRNGVNGSLFADNLAIYITTRSQRVACRALHGVTNKLDAWAAERGLTFSPSKTVRMTFRKGNNEPIEIMQRNKVIPSKESIQFLGMALDSRLNWDINKLRTKAKKALGLRFLCKLKSNTSYIETLITLDDREDQSYEEKERNKMSRVT